MNAIDVTVSSLIINMEKAALERWNNGDPSGFLEISAKDVVYFDPFTATRIDGRAKLAEIYEKLRGVIYVDHYEMMHPRIQAVDRMAVLTYNLVSYAGDGCQKWNCTEVYRLDADEKWRIIQTHWSLTKPDLVNT